MRLMNKPKVFKIILLGSLSKEVLSLFGTGTLNIGMHLHKVDIQDRPLIELWALDVPKVGGFTAAYYRDARQLILCPESQEELTKILKMLAKNGPIKKTVFCLNSEVLVNDDSKIEIFNIVSQEEVIAALKILVPVNNGFELSATAEVESVKSQKCCS